MLKLYGCPNTRSMRVAWALEEAGADYDYEAVILVKGEGRRPSFLRVNPSGKLPVLVDGDLVLSESSAICTYVGDLFPASRLTPAFGTADRGRYNQWMAFAIAEFEQPLGTIAKHRFGLPKELRVPAVEEAAKWEFGRACRVLEKGLGEREFDRLRPSHRRGYHARPHHRLGELRADPGGRRGTAALRGSAAGASGTRTRACPGSCGRA